MKGGLKVTNQTAGLRFDIFERIELPIEVEAIRQLEDIELTPQIQLFADEEQAILRGHLLLVGAYEGGDMRGQHRLQHKIPVEISLPMHRVVDVEHIGVEIENFDVDVLSDRKLSVTGVLSLNGVDGQQREAPFGRNDIDVVISDVDQRKAIQNETVQKQESSTESSVQSEAAVEGERTVNERAASERAANDVVSEPAVNAMHDNVASENVVSEKEDTDVVDATRSEEELTFESPSESSLDFGQEQELEAANEFIAESEFEVESEPELEVQESALQEAVKIAFRQQRADVEAFVEPEEATEQAEVRDAVSQADVGETEEAQAEGETRSETDWKNFLLARENEGNEVPQFKKMKMCIIQKEETLSTIAERYNINPREIILYNRLGEQEVEEGQVIYIPIS